MHHIILFMAFPESERSYLSVSLHVGVLFLDHDLPDHGRSTVRHVGVLFLDHDLPDHGRSTVSDSCETVTGTGQGTSLDKPET
jgi:hypothetical protein